jgi:hypothetical protein
VSHLKKPWTVGVYIAGPIGNGETASGPECEMNIQRAIDLANALMDKGFCVFCPHLTYFWDLRHRRKWKEWLDMDVGWLSLFSQVKGGRVIVVRMRGKSKGADTEVTFANQVKVPVVDEVELIQHMMWLSAHHDGGIPWKPDLWRAWRDGDLVLSRVFDPLTLAERERVEPYTPPMKTQTLIKDGPVAQVASLLERAASPDAPTSINSQGGKQSHLPVRFDLFDAKSMIQLAGILYEGAEKYGENNWHRITSAEHLNHAMSHVYVHMAGNTQDDHLGHAFCRLMMAMRMHREKMEEEMDEAVSSCMTERDIQRINTLGQQQKTERGETEETNPVLGADTHILEHALDDIHRELDERLAVHKFPGKPPSREGSTELSE